MQAAFVSIGLDRDAFLYVEDVVPRPIEDDGEEAGERERRPFRRHSERPRIDDCLKEGQEVVVQVTKDPLSGKGRASRRTSRCRAARSSTCRCRGPMASASRGGSPTRPSASACGRSSKASVPGRAGSRARPRPAATRPSSWPTGLPRRSSGRTIRRKAGNANAPALLHRELDLALRSVRDLVTPDFAAIRVDDPETRDRIAEFSPRSRRSSYRASS